MKKLYKPISIVICVCMFLSIFNVGIIAQDSINQSENRKWIPIEDEFIPNTKGDLPITELGKKILLDIDQPEAVPTKTILSKEHVNRVREQEEDMYSIVFQNRNGTKTMYSFTEPIKYIDKTGKIKDKSTKITDVISELEYLDEYSHVNADNDIHIYFPKELNSSTGMILQYEKLKLELSPIHATKDSISGVKTEKINEDNESVQSVEYERVFGKSTKLRYTPTFSGFKEDIILTEYIGVNEFSFLIETNGLSLIQTEGRYYLADPVTGEICVTIGDLIIYDNITESQVNDNKDSQIIYAHDYKIEMIEKDYKYIITIIVDDKYLKDDARIWPVTIDPSFDITMSGSGNSKTIQDVPIYSTLSSNVTCGANTLNVIGYLPNSLNGVPYGVGRTLMRFPALINNPIVQGLNDKITNISLVMRNGTGNNNSTTIKAYYYTGSASWNENTAVYSNISWSGYGNEINSQTVTSTGWYTFNITSAKSSCQNLAEKGIMLINTSEANSSLCKSFESTESSNKPYITITWDGAQASGINSGSVYRIRSINNLYLHATSSTNIIQETYEGLNGQTGKQLWYVTYNNGYYKLENLGIRMGNLGDKPSMLYAYSAGVKLASGDNNATNQQWAISRTSGGTYYLANRAYPSVVLTVDGPSDYPHLANKITCSQWTFSEVILENYWDGSYYHASGDVMRVNVIITLSAQVTYLTLNDVYRPCEDAWNGITDNICVKIYQAGQPVSPAELTIWVHGIDDDENFTALGRTLSNTGSGPGSGSVNDEWHSVDIWLNIREDADNNLNLESKTGYTDEEWLLTRRKVLTHEIGHALKLAHPHAGSDDYRPVAIMCQGSVKASSNRPICPSGHDKNNLIRKWG